MKIRDANIQNVKETEYFDLQIERHVTWLEARGYNLEEGLPCHGSIETIELGELECVLDPLELAASEATIRFHNGRCRVAKISLHGL